MRCLPNSGYLYYSCMAKLSGKEIQKLARSIVTENPGGIRYSVLVEKISQQTPETPKNTIHGAVWNLDSIFPNEIAKPSRGLFTPTKSENDTGCSAATRTHRTAGVIVLEYVGGELCGGNSIMCSSSP